MDVSIDAIRKALSSTSEFKTNIQTWLIDANDRKKQYRNFLNESQRKELIGFMPLQNTIMNNHKFVNDAVKMFSKGVHSPGRLYPFFGSDTNGVCISLRLDTVFTVVEEGAAHWVLVCALAFNDSDVQEADLFSKPDLPPQAMKWNKNMRVDSLGWRRPFECIENMLYVGEVLSTSSYPRNVLPLAVAKVHFGRVEGIASSRFFLNKPNRPMEVNLQMLKINKLTIMKGGNETTVFDGVSMFGVTIYSRYEIIPSEWPERLFFDNFDIFPYVFQSWMVDGKLNMQKLVNEGNVKILTNFFYDHSFQSCSRPHPSHVYLNYYQVEAPKERMIEMMNTLIDIESKDMILFGCSPLITFSGHVIYAAIPPGEIANRLGLPLIAGDRFHLIQALPLPTGTLHTIDRATEMRDFHAKNSKNMEDQCRESTSRDLIILSDSDDGENRYENINSWSNKKKRDEMVNSPTISHPLPHENYDRFDDVRSSFVDNSINIERETTRENEVSGHRQHNSMEMDNEEEEERRRTRRKDGTLSFSFDSVTSSNDPIERREEEKRRKGLSFSFDDSMDASVPHPSPPLPSYISPVLTSTLISPLPTPSSLSSNSALLTSSIHNERRPQEIEIDGEFIGYLEPLPPCDLSNGQQLLQNRSSSINDPLMERDNYEPIAMEIDEDEEEERIRRRRRIEGLGFSFEDDTSDRDDSMERIEGRSRNESRSQFSLSVDVEDDVQERLKRREGERRNKMFSFSFDDENELNSSPIENRNEERRDHRKDKKKRNRRNEKKKNESSSRHRRPSGSFSFLDEDDGDIVALSPPRNEKSLEQGFRPLKISAAHHARNARISSPQSSRSVDTIDITSSPRSSPKRNGSNSINISSTQFGPLINSLNSRSDDTIVILSPRDEAPVHQAFDPSKTSTYHTTRDAPRQKRDKNPQEEELVVWNREKNDYPLESLTRLPFAAMVIVMDDQLIKQMKVDEVNALVKMINEYSSDGKNRIILVLHLEFENEWLELPLQLRNIDPFAVFLLKHKVENNIDDHMNCCDRVRKMGRNERAVMVYLSPNVNSTLMKNNVLGKMGFKVFNISGVVSYLQSKRYEEEY